MSEQYGNRITAVAEAETQAGYGKAHSVLHKWRKMGTRRLPEIQALDEKATSM